MKRAITAVVFALAPASMAQAGELDFSGDVAMGLGGITQAGVTEITPVTRLDAEASLTFEFDIGVEVGIVVPVRSDGALDGAAIRITHN